MKQLIDRTGTARLRSTFLSAVCALVAATTLAPGAARAQAAATIGEGLSIGWAQVFVADAKGIWKHQGLDITPVTFPSGRLVLDAVIGGRTLFGTAAETPIVFAALNNLPVRIIATTNNGAGKPWECFDLITTSNINKVEDIKGKRIGYAQGTNGHYYLSQLLAKAKLKMSDITAISLSPADFGTSMLNGSLDGYVWLEPVVSQTLAAGNGKFHVIPTPGIYQAISAVVTMQATIDKQPELLKKSMAALAQADRYAAEHPADAMKVVSDRVNFSPDLMQSYWPQLNLGVGLDKKAVVAELQKQAQWAIDNKLVRPDAVMPDFNTIVTTAFLPGAQ